MRHLLLTTCAYALIAAAAALPAHAVALPANTQTSSSAETSNSVEKIDNATVKPLTGNDLISAQKKARLEAEQAQREALLEQQSKAREAAAIAKQTTALEQQALGKAALTTLGEKDFPDLQSKLDALKLLNQETGGKIDQNTMIGLQRELRLEAEQAQRETLLQQQSEAREAAAIAKEKAALEQQAQREALLQQQNEAGDAASVAKHKAALEQQALGKAALTTLGEKDFPDLQSKLEALSALNQETGGKIDQNTMIGLQRELRLEAEQAQRETLLQQQSEAREAAAIAKEKAALEQQAQREALLQQQNEAGDAASVAKHKAALEQQALGQAALDRLNGQEFPNLQSKLEALSALNQVTGGKIDQNTMIGLHRQLRLQEEQAQRDALQAAQAAESAAYQQWADDQRALSQASLSQSQEALRARLDEAATLRNEARQQGGNRQGGNSGGRYSRTPGSAFDRQGGR